MEMKRLRSMSSVTRMVTWRNEEERHRFSVREKVSDKSRAETF